MYPTKSMHDYMTEMNRLFPKNNENDAFQSPLTPHKSFNQSMAPSSSSTDTSPDSDMTQHRFQPEPFQPQYERQQDHFDRQYEYQRRQYESYVKEEQEVPFMPQTYETPFVMRRQRPIVGRNIMSVSDNQIPKMNEVPNAWPEDSLSFSPPSNTSTEQKYNQNALYKLFPTENTGMEFKTPLNTSPNSFTTSPDMSNFRNMSPRMTSASPSMSNMSLRMSDMAPRMSEMSSRMSDMSPRLPEMSPRMSEMSPRLPEMSPRMSEMSSSWKMSPGSTTSSRFPMPTFKDPIVGPATYRPNMGPTKMCTFCRKNGETPLVYMTHTVKEKIANKNIVTCPILRSHVCTTCGASGDNAHTMTYCPVLRNTNNGLPLQSTTITLKNTRIKSNGRRRY